MDRSSAAIVTVPTTLDQAHFLQEHEHSPDGVRIGGAPPDQILLDHRVFLGQQCEKHELVGSDSKRGKHILGLAVERQVGATEVHSQ